MELPIYQVDAFQGARVAIAGRAVEYLAGRITV